MNLETSAKPPTRDSVTSYMKTSQGTVVPPAYDDDYGGRPDLTAETRLSPPIDDPTFEDLKNYNSELINKSEKSSQQTNSSRRKKRESKKAKTNKFEEEDIINKILESPELLQKLKKRLNIKSNDEEEYVTVYLVGNFGKFKTRPSDVFICPQHITLLYTEKGGDDDLLFEPPPDEVFKIQIPMENGSYKTVLAKHFGFITDIPGFGKIVVMPSIPEQYENEGISGEI